MRRRKILHSTYVQYAILHLRMVVYTANFLVLEPTALIYILKERRCNEDQRGVRKLKIEPVIR